MIIVRSYEMKDEQKWLLCLKDAYFSSEYVDHLVKMKPRYENPSIELVAIENDQILGLIDIEIWRLIVNYFVFNGVNEV